MNVIRPGIDREFERVMGAETVRHPRHGGTGGEWDTLRRQPRRVLRTLTGARLLTPGGLFPDEATEHCISPNTGINDVCEAMDWYCRTAMLAIRESRARHHHERHLALAKRHGYTTYFRYRQFLAIERGYPTYRAERHAKWLD